jgi:L-asparaginase II
MPRIEQWRGAQLEAVHTFSAVAVQGEQTVLSWGSDVSTTWRSAAKPFQLAVSLELLGDPEHSSEELAIGSASHSAQPEHLHHVRAILKRYALSPSGLRCGGHAPASPEAYAELLRSGGSVNDLHNNCSGKHAFMLAAATAQGWPADYRPADHPLQVRIAEAMSEVSAETPTWAIDGCGVPTWCHSLEAIARAWSRLASATADPDDTRLGTVGRAMAKHPFLVSGSDRLDLHLAHGAQETLITKVGAAGLLGMALPERGLGIALKTHAGNDKARAPAAEALLEALAPGAWIRPDPWPGPEVRNVVGERVGELRFCAPPVQG